MDSNLHGLGPGRIYAIRPPQQKRERERRDPGKKPFTLDPPGGPESPPDDEPDTERAHISSKSKDEAGNRLDLTA